MGKTSFNSLGEIIKREREMLGMSIDDLSSVAEISSTYIERIEENHILKPYPKFISVLSDALGVNLQFYLQHDLLNEDRAVYSENDSYIERDDESANNSSESFSNLTSIKERVEDTHTRRTFIIRNDLLKRLRENSEEKWGFMTEFINLAIENGLDEFEKHNQEEID